MSAVSEAFTPSILTEPVTTHVTLAGAPLRTFAAQSWAAPNSKCPDLTVPLLNWQNDRVGSIVLPGSIFNVPVRRDILHRVVRWQLAKRRQVRVTEHSRITRLPPVRAVEAVVSLT